MPDDRLPDDRPFEIALGRRLALWAVLLALAARAVAILIFADFDPATAQLWEYGLQGACATLSQGPLCLYKFTDGFAQAYPSAFMPPLLSYAWWGLFQVFGVTATAVGVFYALNALIGAACVALTHRLARQLAFGDMAAGAAALMIALYPSFVMVSATTHNTNVAVALFLALTSLAVELARKPAIGGALLFGLLAGFAVLNRSEALIIAPALVVAAGVLGRSIATPLIALAVMAAVIAPWAARNDALFGKPIPTAQSAGYNFWKGFYPGSNGSGDLTETDPAFVAERDAVRAAIPVGPRYESEVDAAYMAKAREAMAQMTLLDHARLAALKAAKLWAFDWSDPLARSPAYLAAWSIATMLAAAGLASLWRARRRVRWDAVAMVVLVCGGITAAHMATFVHARYRMHLEPYLFILAGAALADMWRALTVRRARQVPL
ncbi:MAG: glycosyltransferase family 39 protein [Alphaproteobacteria bacterium]|nr:glycosyltransferase family 39 protein [Alphaproteobacteria bacterium]